MKNSRLTKFIAVAGLACFVCQPHDATAQVLTDFVDHGIPAKVSESRGVLAARDTAGTPLIVTIAQDQYKTGARCSLLVIDARTGKTEQYWYPEKEAATGDAYAIMRTPDGKIYTATNTTFLEFDLDKRKWTYNATVDGFPLSFTRTPDGSVFFANYSTSSLYRFNPKTRALEKLVQLDPQQQYPTYLEAGTDGWIYAGIGTARTNIVAYNPQTGERKQLIDEATRKTGTSYVFEATDGHIYGREFSSTEGRLLKLSDGTATFVEGNPTNPTRARTAGAIIWGTMLRTFPGGGEIVNFSLPEKYAEVSFDGQRKRITFDYETSGPGIISLAVGPNNKLYGSTRHPIHVFTLDPVQKTLVDNGTIPQISGGNFGAFGTNGKYLVGDSYSFGMVYEYDTTQPWNVPATTWNAKTNSWNIPTEGDGINPRIVGTFPEVSRPRSSVKLPNGDILFGGYPAYGFTGGGLVTYVSATREAKVKPATELLPNHSTVALELLNPQTVVGGTSIETPGGGVVMAKEAELYLLDTATQTVTYRTVPIPGARSIFDLHIAPDGKVFGLTNNAQFFVLDPQTKTVVHRADWTEWGVAFNPGHAMWNAPNGRVGVLFPKVAIEIQPDYSVRKLADLPETAGAGGAVLNNRLYFATGSRLRSVGLTELVKKRP
jgi:streptogramin lyase